jgi:hypothetical protein
MACEATSQLPSGSIMHHPQFAVITLSGIVAWIDAGAATSSWQCANTHVGRVNNAGGTLQ